MATEGSPQRGGSRSRGAERYLRKAQESLASAEADFAAARYNSAANRAYYTGFQAAVAALIHWGIRGAGTEWAHRFVPDEFGTQLIRRRKVFPDHVRGHLNHLFLVRLIADYEVDDVSEKQANRSLVRAQEMVGLIESRMTERRVKETAPEYNVGMKVKSKDPRRHVEDFKHRILASYPDVDFEVIQRDDRDFTVKVYGDYDDMGDVPEVLGDAGIDLLMDEDVWIVVLGLRRRTSDE